ncbi:hypothetical protein L3Q82_014137 [Scortum barcoo]|uniref:Uncharacterized protein n=1 Tax=Scortum barcoo TaxID=214431 RepID=A0ACB8VXV3_9TELE|nr:hypothetical protein L3Q82_014137 [Scortum barcoo]
MMMGLHYNLQHFDSPGAYVRILFVDFSLAFNTNHPRTSSTPNSPSSLCQLPPVSGSQTSCLTHRAPGQLALVPPRGSSLPPPVLTVFPPSSAELQSNKASLVCLSSQSVPFADVSWLSGGSPVSSGISTSTAVQQADRTFQISSYLAIQTSDWNMDKVYTCKVSLGSTDFREKHQQVQLSH